MSTTILKSIVCIVTGKSLSRCLPCSRLFALSVGRSLSHQLQLRTCAIGYSSQYSQYQDSTSTVPHQYWMTCGSRAASPASGRPASLGTPHFLRTFVNHATYGDCRGALLSNWCLLERRSKIFGVCYIISWLHERTVHKNAETSKTAY